MKHYKFENMNIKDFLHSLFNKRQGFTEVISNKEALLNRSKVDDKMIDKREKDNIKEVWE